MSVSSRLAEEAFVWIRGCRSRAPDVVLYLIPGFLNLFSERSRLHAIIGLRRHHAEKGLFFFDNWWKFLRRGRLETGEIVSGIIFCFLR